MLIVWKGFSSFTWHTESMHDLYVLQFMAKEIGGSYSFIWAVKKNRSIILPGMEARSSTVQQGSWFASCKDVFCSWNYVTVTTKATFKESLRGFAYSLMGQVSVAVAGV